MDKIDNYSRYKTIYFIYSFYESIDIFDIIKEKRQKEKKKELNKILNGFYEYCNEFKEEYDFEENDITNNILEFRNNNINDEFLYYNISSPSS